MRYQIIPLEMGSIVERKIFQKNTMEIKCGTIWKLGYITTKVKPLFLNDYDANIGISISDIPEAIISKTYGEKRVIHFSENIKENLQNELTDIFYYKSKKYSKKYANVFLDLGWNEISYDHLIFGQIEIKEIEEIKATELSYK